MKPTLAILAVVGGAIASPLAAQLAVELPPLTVYSPRVANQSPVATFAMPVSALRYEPRVDLQGRNLVEGQADVTLRGGIFENTGFRGGVLSLLDPQTGHYFAEIPIAPAMLGAPSVLTGADLALRTSNATAGAVAYDWRPIRNGGALQVGSGPHELWRGDAYAGWVGGSVAAGRRTGVDVALAHSESAGPIAFGDHEFDRVNVRMQLAGVSAQTDLFVGYQAKFYGWPNLYTPFDSNETENLQTVLVMANHRIDLGGGDFLAIGAYHRRNKDDYAFNRFAPLTATHPFQHTTWLDAVAAEGRRDIGALVVNARVEIMTDFLKSTSLNFGRYWSRTLTKVALVPEKTWSDAAGASVTVKLGATYDDSNRDSGAVSPVFEIARDIPGAAVRRVFAVYAETTQEPTYTALNSSAASGLFRGNRDLRRETSRTLELGASGTVAGWNVQATAFARRDEDLVDWTYRFGVTARSANPVDVDTIGFEAVARRAWKAIDLVFGYTALSKDPDYRNALVDASFYALNYARHRLTTAAVLRLGHGLELRIDNVARLQASNPLRTTGGDEAVLSTVAVLLRPPTWRGIEFSAQLDNVWDSRFQDVPAVPAAPRTWSLGVNYVW